jgi:hypothetical protein
MRVLCAIVVAQSPRPMAIETELWPQRAAAPNASGPLHPGHPRVHQGNTPLCIFLCDSPYFLYDKLVPFAENFVSEIAAMLFYLKYWVQLFTKLPF